MYALLFIFFHVIVIFNAVTPYLSLHSLRKNYYYVNIKSTTLCVNSRTISELKQKALQSVN